MNYPKCSVKLGDNTELNISNNIGNNLIDAMNEAENYIHIISQNISSNLVKHLKKLKEEKPTLDIKILFSDRKNFLQNPNDIEKFRELLEFSWKENPDKIDKKTKKIKSLNRSRIFFKFFFLLLLLIPIAVIAIFHIPQLKYLTSYAEPYIAYVKPYIPEGFDHTDLMYYTVGGAFLFFLLLFILKMSSIKRKIKFFSTANIEDPHFEETLDFKCIECYEKSAENLEKTNPRVFPHTKVYLMDFKPYNNDSFVDKAFVSSTNFLFGDSEEELIETLVESKEHNVCKELKRFFQEMYSFDFLLHSKEAIGKTIYKKEISEKKSFFDN